jgi:hypothetical protein
MERLLFIMELAQEAGACANPINAPELKQLKQLKQLKLDSAFND